MINDDTLANRLNNFIINKTETSNVEESSTVVNESIESDKSAGRSIKFYDILSVVWDIVLEFAIMTIIGIAITVLFSISTNLLGIWCIGYVFYYIAKAIEKYMNKICVKK